MKKVKTMKLEEHQQRLLKFLKYTVLSLFGASFIGMVLLVLVNLLPLDRIRFNVKASLPVFEREGEIFNWAPDNSFAYCDNFTDALMLNTASFETDESYLKRALMDYRFQSEKPYASQVESLTESMNSDVISSENSLEYSRYWHGYLLWLKPLLSVFNYQEIRIINMMFQFIMLIVVLKELNDRCGLKYTIAFLTAIFMICPITTAMCMQLSAVYYVTLFSCLFILKKDKETMNKGWRILLWTGIATSFFDLLTYPLVSLGIPLILLLICNKESIVKRIKMMIAGSAAWGIGYFGMWILKWVYAYLLTGYNTIQNAMENLEVRTGSDLVYSRTEIIQINFDQLNIQPFQFMLLIFALFIAFRMWKYRKKFKLNISSLSILLIGIYPIVWYIVLANHSMIHYWMTYRDMIVSIFAIEIVLLENITNRRKKI